MCAVPLSPARPQRIREWLWLEGTSGCDPVQLPAQTGHLEQAAKAAPCICIDALARQAKIFQKGDFSREAL